jgi:hypothetical protein
MARRSSNPLPNWKQGVDPDQSGPEIEVKPAAWSEAAANPNSKEYQLQSRSVAIVRRLNGIAPGDFSRWNDRLDRQALAVYRKLMAGEELPRHWRPQHKEPPPFDPTSWITPRQSSR